MSLRKRSWDPKSQKNIIKKEVAEHQSRFSANYEKEAISELRKRKATFIPEEEGKVGRLDFLYEAPPGHKESQDDSVVNQTEDPDVLQFKRRFLKGNEYKPSPLIDNILIAEARCSGFKSDGSPNDDYHRKLDSIKGIDRAHVRSLDSQAKAELLEYLKKVETDKTGGKNKKRKHRKERKRKKHKKTK